MSSPPFPQRDGKIHQMRGRFSVCPSSSSTSTVKPTGHRVTINYLASFPPDSCNSGAEASANLIVCPSTLIVSPSIISVTSPMIHRAFLDEHFTVEDGAEVISIGSSNDSLNVSSNGFSNDSSKLQLVPSQSPPLEIAGRPHVRHL